MPREILVDWTTVNGAGKVSVFYFIQATAVASQRDELATFLGSIDGALSTGTSWSIRTTGRDLISASGGLEDAWTDPTVYVGAGSGGSVPVADSTQGLIRWHTDHIVGSRFLQGRTYIPGVASGSLSGGNLLAATATAWQVAGQALIDAGVQLAVWHRPVAGAGGEAWAADVCSVNSEFAVLRRRRD